MNEKIGILAGWGRYPIVLAKALKRQGYSVYCCGIHGHADPVLADICDGFELKGIAKLGGQIGYFKQNGVKLATMAGKIFKTILFERFVWLKHIPDWRCCVTFYPHFLTLTQDQKDDTMLQAVVDAYASDGIRFAPATDFAPELLVKHGTLTRQSPGHNLLKDVQFGWELAKSMGALDVGQTVIVKGRAALAVEAIEGTDACIRRAGQLAERGAFTVVKVAKPQQDMRFDVPTIGLGTLETMKEAGGTLLVVEAGKTIIIDEPEVIDYANRNGIMIVACRNNEAQRAEAA